MKIAWVVKYSPSLSNSALVRAARACDEVRRFAGESVCIEPPRGVRKADWLERGVVDVVERLAGFDVVVLQKIWNVAAVAALRRLGIPFVFDADDEFDESLLMHRQIIRCAEAVVCSSSVSRRELSAFSSNIFEIPCYPEEPVQHAAAPHDSSRVIIWTGYSDSIVEVESLRPVLLRLKSEIGAHLILHSNKGLHPSWGEIAECIKFELDEKDAVMRRGHVGICNKPMTPDLLRKTEDKIVTYMAYGIVPVCSPIPSYRDVLRDESAGFLVDPRDAATWYARIAGLLTSPSTWQRMSDAGRALVQSKYGSARITDVWWQAVKSAEGRPRHVCP